MRASLANFALVRASFTLTPAISLHVVYMQGLLRNDKKLSVHLSSPVFLHAPQTESAWPIQSGQFNAGVDDALSAAGWVAEEAEGFHGGALALNLWSKSFTSGSSYSLEITGDQMIAGVVGTAPVQ